MITWEPIKLIDTCDHSLFYEAVGYDEHNEYSGVIEICCDEIVGVSEVEKIDKPLIKNI